VRRANQPLKVGYIIFNEAFWRGVLWTQAIELLKTMPASSTQYKLVVVSFVPLLNCMLDWSEIRGVQRYLSESDIGLLLVPTPFLFSRYCHIRWFLLPVFILTTVPPLALIVLLWRLDLLHARAYPASLAASIVKKLLGTKFIFDPRSQFPEENVTARNWSRDSLTYKIWKRLERHLLAASDCAVPISAPFAQYFAAAYAHTRSSEIPNNVDTDKFVFSAADRHSVRKEHGLGDKLVFVYLGSIGGWNDPRVYADYMLKMRGLTMPYCFFFVLHRSKRATKLLNSAFRAKGISSREYVVAHSPRDRVPSFLSACDIGLQVMGSGDARIGTKFVEYLAMGLPVIVNSNVQGAAEYVRRFDLGLVLDLDADDFLNQVEDLIRRRAEIGERCRAVAAERFSNQVVAAKYRTIYDELLGGPAHA